MVFLGILIVVALVKPSASVNSVVPQGAYSSQPFLTGFLEGYNTMDALASLAFGIIVVQVIKGLGVEEPSAIAGNTVRAGVFSCILMAVIYLAVTIVGAQSRGFAEVAGNGGIAFAQIAQHYFGGIGLFILAATITLACLKTAVGLITSCSETFAALFPNGPKYRSWAIIFSLMSLLFSNLGLSSIIKFSIPVLMFLYPLSIVLILLALLGGLFKHSRSVYLCTIIFTLFGAVYDLLRTLPEGLRQPLHLDPVIDAVGGILPLASLGLGWIVPSIIGLVIGIIIYKVRK